MATLKQNRAALVLAGGAARGAYEAGVAQYCFREVARSLGHPVSIPIRCGTSAGALNSCQLAAFAHDPEAGALRLVDEWTSLRLRDILRPELCEALAMARGLVARPRARSFGHRAKGGLVDPRGLEAIVRRAIPFRAIDRHLRSGLLEAVTVSTTHVASGRTTVFVDRHAPGVPAWRDDPATCAVRTTLGVDHVMASSAIPLLFPPRAIDGVPHCDGGLRQYVPLSPAHRLGADSIIVVSPQSPAGTESALAAVREQSVTSPLYLLGKTLDALLGDRMDADIDRVQMVNLLLEAGRRRYGSGFVAAVNAEMGRAGALALRPLQMVVVQASERLGAIAADYVGTSLFAARARGTLGRALRQLADADTEGDLLSYLLFDGAFAERLVELGRADARRHHDELCAALDGRRHTQSPRAAGHGMSMVRALEVTGARSRRAPAG